MTSTTNLNLAMAVIASHREARNWTDEAVAVDLLAQLGIDPMGEAADVHDTYAAASRQATMARINEQRQRVAQEMAQAAWQARYDDQQFRNAIAADPNAATSPATPFPTMDDLVARQSAQGQAARDAAAAKLAADAAAADTKAVAEAATARMLAERDAREASERNARAAAGLPADGTAPPIATPQPEPQAVQATGRPNPTRETAPMPILGNQAIQSGVPLPPPPAVAIAAATNPGEEAGHAV